MVKKLIVSQIFCIYLVENLLVTKAHAITSLKPDAEKILVTTRKHWSIENNLHWQLDVSFNEDNLRKKKNAAQNMSLPNKFALARLKRDKSEGSIKGKRKKAGWDVEFLRLMLTVW